MNFKCIVRCCAFLLMTLALAACGGETTVVKTVTEPARPTEAPGDASDASAGGAGATTAEAGDSLTVDTGDTSLAIRVVSVLDPLAVGQFDEPQETAGRFVGVRLSVRNIGGAAYSDALSNGASLILRGDEQAETSIVSGGPCDGSFASSLKLAAGDKRVGCIAFEVDSRKPVRSFQFTPNSGFADETAEWDLRTAALVASASASDEAVEPEAVENDAPRSGRFTACDANISARAGATTCPFAENAFYEYWTSGRSESISVYSPSAGTTIGASCSSDGDEVTCEADDGGAARFSESALDAYTQSQADRFAASHEVEP